MNNRTDKILLSIQIVCGIAIGILALEMIPSKYEQCSVLSYITTQCKE